MRKQKTIEFQGNTFRFTYGNVDAADNRTGIFLIKEILQGDEFVFGGQKSDVTVEQTEQMISKMIEMGGKEI